jgi:hypothetical protein
MHAPLYDGRSSDEIPAGARLTSMSGIWLLLLAHLPCLPNELAAPPPATSPPAAFTRATPQLASRYLLRALTTPGWTPAPLPAPLAMREEARYSVGYGLFGSIGELRLSIDDERVDGSRRLLKVGGYGQGAILGLGRTEKRIDGEFDPATLNSRRWTMARTGGEAVTDVMEQAQAGVVTMTRQRPGQAQTNRQATFQAITLDPVGLLMRLRVAPPSAGQPAVLQLLDGQALWRVTLTLAGRESLSISEHTMAVLRIEGRADPIFYNGSDAPDRPRRTFTVWLSDDDTRIPLRLTLPIGPGEVLVELLELTRTPRAALFHE